MTKVKTATVGGAPSPAGEEMIEQPPREQPKPTPSVYLTQGELIRYVRAILPLAYIEQNQDGCFIMTRRGARRPLTEPMLNDNQAWLRAAEMLGWEKNPSVPA